ncbi:MAG: hypothetical protein D6731_20100 [Planctomycetota bacterium]|nr:MAG: hypothetical protein D6731_20100 [Planctomycetota bacterium]
MPPTAEARYYEPHVRSTLYTYCTRCHSDTSNAASAAYLLNGFPVDDTSFQNTLARIDVQDPENSLLLLKATGLVAHGGGAVLRVDEVATEWLLNWVRQGAVRDQYANAPSTFARNVRPFVTAQCSGCHSGGTGGFRAGGTLDQDYQSMLSHTDPGNPTGSSVLTKCDGSRGHAGGAPWRPPSAERDAILKWIADGRRFTQ